MSSNDAEKFKLVQREAFELFIKKNSDYGNAYKTYGFIGILTRLGDKISRCLNTSKNNITLVDESLLDSIVDLNNYCTLAIMEYKH